MVRRDRDPWVVWGDPEKFWKNRPAYMYLLGDYIRTHPEGVTKTEMEHDVAKRIDGYLEKLLRGCQAWSDESLATRQDVPVRYYADCFDAEAYSFPGTYRLLLDEPEKVILYDTETTGKNEFRNDEVLQLSIINGNGEILFRSNFRPSDRKMDEGWSEAERIHGISREMIRDCLTIHEFSDEIEDIIDSSKAIIGYNYPFDTKILIDEGISIRPKMRACAMRDFAPIYGEYDEYHENFRWQKLVVAAGHVRYTFKAHDSLNDCLATLEVARFIADRLEKEGRI